MPYTPPNYNEQLAWDTPGKTYRRVRYIGIWNNPDGSATVQLLESDAAFIDGVKTNIRESVGGITFSINTKNMEDLLHQFQLRNPSSDALVDGSNANYAEVLALLYSMCRDRCLMRDAADQLAADQVEPVVITDTGEEPQP